MGYQNYQPFLGYGPDDVHNLQGVAAVQISGRLVGDNDGRVLDNRPGDGDTLPLSAGKHIGVPVPVAVHSHLLQHIIDPLTDLVPVFHSHHPQRDGDIIKDSHVVHQIVILEDITHVQCPDLVHLTGHAPGDPLPIDIDLALVHLVQAADGIQQCGLAASGWTQQSHQTLSLQVQGGVIDGVDFVSSPPEEIFVDMLQSDHTIPPP